MSEEIVESTGSEVDASQPSGEASPTQESSQPAQTAASNQGEMPSASTNKEAPFHEHPRFKELIEERNEFRRQNSEYMQRLQQLESQVQKFKQPEQVTKDELVEQLKEANPAFAERFTKLEQSLSQIEQFKQFQEQIRQEGIRNQVGSKMQELYSSNKVPDERKPMYEAYIKSLAYETKSDNINDLDKFFKQAHELYSKAFDEYERKVKASYVVSKKSDLTPASTTGGTAPAIKSPASAPLSLEDVKSQALKELRAARQKI